MRGHASVVPTVVTQVEQEIHLLECSMLNSDLPPGDILWYKQSLHWCRVEEDGQKAPWTSLLSVPASTDLFGSNLVAYDFPFL